MSKMRLLACASILFTAPFFGASCAAPSPEPKAAPPPPREAPVPSAEDATPEVNAPEDKHEKVALEVPTECAAEGADEVCTPPSGFVDELCAKRQPNVALTLFSKGSPWVRTYVRVRNMEAWLVGGRRASPQKLALFEEVIIVRDRSAGEGGIKVSGAGSFDVVRWDGSCVSVMSDEVSTRRPGTPDVAPIKWRRLDPGIRSALEKDKRIAYREEKRREHCKGAKSSNRCKAATKRLSRMVATFIRDGGDVPSPTVLE